MNLEEALSVRKLLRRHGIPRYRLKHIVQKKTHFATVLAVNDTLRQLTTACPGAFSAALHWFASSDYCGKARVEERQKMRPPTFELEELSNWPVVRNGAGLCKVESSIAGPPHR